MRCMCGIAGYVSTGEATDRTLLIRALAGALRHRGPDDEGYFFAPGVGLGMRRLSIVDLECGQQPITNEDGSVRVAFNGEIYNYVELREELAKRGHRLTTKSDTETLPHLYEERSEEHTSELQSRQ